MGFEIDKSAEELQQKGTQFISNEQAVEEQSTSAAPLTDAETQDLTYNLSGEAQSTGFTDKEAEALTETLSGQESVIGDSANFNTKNDKNIPVQQNVFQSIEQENIQNSVPNFIQILINQYPNITKVYLREGILTFLDKNNIAIRDKNGIPLRIDLNNTQNLSPINFIALFFNQNNGEADINTLVQLSALQEKLKNPEEAESFYHALLTQNEFKHFKSLSNEEQTNYITAKVVTTFAENTIPEPLKNYINANNNNPEQQNIIHLPIQELNAKDFRIRINLANSIDELKMIRGVLETMPYSKAEKQMLYNECTKQQGKIQILNNEEALSNNIDSEKQNNNFDEERIKSGVAFALFKKCKTPIQREMANIILRDKRLYLAQNNLNPIIDTMLENCKTQEDLTIRKKLLEKTLQIPNLIENGVLNNSVLLSISNANAETFNLQLNILDAYRIQLENPKSDNNKICEYLKELTELVSNHNKPEQIEFCNLVLFDEELKHNETALKTLLIVLRSDSKENNTFGIIYNILKINPNKFNADDIYNAANSLIYNEADTANFIGKFVKNQFEIKNCNSIEEEIITTLIKKDVKIYEDFVDNRACTDKNLYDLFKHSQHSYEKDILSHLCQYKQYSAENIIDILKYSSEKTSDITKQVLEKRNITINEKIHVLFTIKNNYLETDYIKMFLDKKNVNLNSLPKFLNSIKTLEKYNVKNIYEINPDKIDKYLQLIQNPKIAPWVDEMLEQGWDIETISQLNHTKLKYYASKDNCIIDTENSDIQFFVDLGFKNKEAERIIQAISKDGIINTEMRQAAVDLLKSGIPKHRIADILSAANASGEYNAQITADTLALKHLGLNEFLERYLPVANNLSQEEFRITFDAKTRDKLITMINNIPNSKRPALRAKGFNIEGILKKLNSKFYEENNGEDSTITDNSTTYDKEKYFIDKYHVPESISNSKEKMFEFANAKYNELKAQNQSNKILNRWFDFIEEESELKNNPFIKVIICEYVTQELNTGNPSLPAVPNKELVQNILAQAVNTEEKQSADTLPIEINGRKMFWKSIHEANGVKNNKIHALIDETGEPQLYIKEGKNGKIEEIKNRYNKNTIPVTYIDFIQDYKNKKNLNGYEEEIQAVKQNKPYFDSSKTELEKLATNKNHKAILEKMGIDVITLPDGTLEISHYTSYLDGITLSEYGINENDLLANVSKIKGNADFKDSNATALPELKNIGGKIRFGENEIEDLHSLEEINKKKIRWEFS